MNPLSNYIDRNFNDLNIHEIVDVYNIYAEYNKYNCDEPYLEVLYRFGRPDKKDTIKYITQYYDLYTVEKFFEEWTN